MTKLELKKKLNDIGTKQSVYSLDGGVHDDRYVLSQETIGEWSVYYSESGVLAKESLMKKIRHANIPSTGYNLTQP